MTIYLPSSNCKLFPNGRFYKFRAVFQQGINHGISNKKDLIVLSPAAFSQIFIGRFGSGKKIISYRVSNHPVNFFRRRSRSPERIPPSTWATLILFNFLAAIEHAIVEVTSPTTITRSGLFFHQYLFITNQDRCGLFCLRSTSRPQD